MRKPTKQPKQQGIGTPRPGQQNPVRERAQQFTPASISSRPNVGPAPTAAQSAANLAARNAQVAQETLARNGQPYVPQPLVTNLPGGNQTYESPAGPTINQQAQQFSNNATPAFIGGGTGVYAQTPLPEGITNQAQYQQYLEEQRRQAGQSEFNAAQAQYDQQRRFVSQQPQQNSFVPWQNGAPAQQELAKQGVNQAPLRQPAPSNQQRPPLFPGWGRR